MDPENDEVKRNRARSCNFLLFRNNIPIIFHIFVQTKNTEMKLMNELF